ncbi:MAG: hypothetical protein RIQ81_1409 [Pseudomonadota bacterium]
MENVPCGGSPLPSEDLFVTIGKSIEVWLCFAGITAIDALSWVGRIKMIHKVRLVPCAFAPLHWNQLLAIRTDHDFARRT